MKKNSNQVEAFSAHECLTCSLAVHCSHVMEKNALKSGISQIRHGKVISLSHKEADLQL